uniref:GNAT family N-acetyltransferase n=1 Tax=Thaumasiovibrio occultus TaxID=1891184 RepID=UPI000B350648|nr:GNAT family N-acetyltransferase [Thaumasiovibrio occultus]
MNQKLLTISKLQPFEYASAVHVWMQAAKNNPQWQDKRELMSFRRLLLQDYLPTLDCVAIRNEKQRILGLMGFANKQVYMLSVLPSVQRQGLARRLLNYGIDEYGVCKAEVFAANLPAIRLFHAQGFYSVARHERDHIGRPTPWYEMRYL